MMNSHSSPHERMLAYLREGDQLLPPGARGAREGETLYDKVSAAAEPPGAASNHLEPPDPSPEAWYEDGLDAVLGRSVVKW
ncbi:hypothetical protein SAMN05216268_104373 [Streptomyces yunnanensis]|uniref:Uncharacterized protein n=1 Tax=Streptomyces yunnanensis TaxID=156453 RepID=A0A9X8MQQ1_9ACTN|nr:hypothetical protein SAMN05216268_104373 [Streptomyces yunnanensis]